MIANLVFQKKFKIHYNKKKMKEKKNCFKELFLES